MTCHYFHEFEWVPQKSFNYNQFSFFSGSFERFTSKDTFKTSRSSWTTNRTSTKETFATPTPTPSWWDIKYTFIRTGKTPSEFWVCSARSSSFFNEFEFHRVSNCRVWTFIKLNFCSSISSFGSSNTSFLSFFLSSRLAEFEFWGLKLVEFLSFE